MSTPEAEGPPEPKMVERPEPWTDQLAPMLAVGLLIIVIFGMLQRLGLAVDFTDEAFSTALPLPLRARRQAVHRRDQLRADGGHDRDALRLGVPEGSRLLDGPHLVRPLPLPRLQAWRLRRGLPHDPSLHELAARARELALLHRIRRALDPEPWLQHARRVVLRARQLRRGAPVRRHRGLVQRPDLGRRVPWPRVDGVSAANAPDVRVRCDDLPRRRQAPAVEVVLVLRSAAAASSSQSSSRCSFAPAGTTYRR